MDKAITPGALVDAILADNGSTCYIDSLLLARKYAEYINKGEYALVEIDAEHPIREHAVKVLKAVDTVPVTFDRIFALKKRDSYEIFISFDGDFFWN